jgi:hypothetical protein
MKSNKPLERGIKMLKDFLELIETMEGLEIQFKVGTESELIIKGDFLTMAKLAAQIASQRAKDDKNKSKFMN